MEYFSLWWPQWISTREPQGGYGKARDIMGEEHCNVDVSKNFGRDFRGWFVRLSGVR